jgi:hypothetical protein
MSSFHEERERLYTEIQLLRDQRNALLIELTECRSRNHELERELVDLLYEVDQLKSGQLEGDES